MSAMERAREAVEDAVSTQLWAGTFGTASITEAVLSALASLSRADRLALLLTSEEQAAWAVVPRKPTNRMCAAGGPEVRKAVLGDGDMHAIWAAMIEVSEADHAGA